MAWTAPALGSEFAVSEIVTAAKMNLKLADNLRYLKGLDGPVVIDNTLNAVLTTGASVGAEGTANGSNARLRLAAKQAGGAVVDWRIFANALSNAGEFSIYDNQAALERLRIDANGNVGIGTTAPQAKLHVKGAAGGNVGFFEGNGITSGTVTVLPTGSFTKFMCIFGGARDDTALTYNTFAQTLPTGSGVVIFGPAGNQLQVLTTSGGVTISRFSGADAYSFCGWVFYI